MRGVRLGLVFVAGCAAAESTAVPPAVRDRTLPLLEALSDPDPDVRCRARTELRHLASSAEPQLRRWTAHPDPEVAGRCRDLLQELEEERRLPVGRIVALGRPPRTFYLDPAGRREFVPGDRFELLRGTSWVATAEFETDVGRPPFARMRIVDGDADGFHEYELTVVPGGAEVRREAQSTPVVASITLVDEESAYLEIGFRQRDGVQAGEILQVLRNTDVVGKVIILTVAPCASIVAPWGRTPIEDLQVGDRVVRRGDFDPTSKTSAR